jgi:hypothetical protein
MSNNTNFEQTTYISDFKRPLSLIDSIIYTVYSNFTLILILSTLVYFLIKILKSAIAKYEEMNLFNINNMTEEEKKLHYFTQKLTNINQRYFDKAASIQANKGKLII